MLPSRRSVRSRSCCFLVLVVAAASCFRARHAAFLGGRGRQPADWQSPGHRRHDRSLCGSGHREDGRDLNNPRVQGARGSEQPGAIPTSLAHVLAAVAAAVLLTTSLQQPVVASPAGPELLRPGSAAVQMLEAGAPSQHVTSLAPPRAVEGLGDVQPSIMTALTTITKPELPDWRALLKPEWREALRADEKAAWRRVPKTVLKRLRSVAPILADMRSDVFAESWDSLSIYPPLLRAYLPVFDRYTSAAFPEDTAVDKSLRKSLQYESGAFTSYITDLETAVSNRQLVKAEEASALLSLSYDRYLKAGDLYEGYDPGTSTQSGDADTTESQLDYEPPELDPPLTRDDIVVLVGPDRGQAGKVLWVARTNGEAQYAIVRLQFNPAIQDSEVKAFNYRWIARSKSSKDTLLRDIVCGFIASIIACTIVYPIDSAKVRLQTGRAAIPSAEEGGFPRLFDGLLLNLGREAPNASILLGTFNYLKRAFLSATLQATNSALSNVTVIRFTAMVPAGAIADALGSTVRVPFELMNKQVQAGKAKDFAGAADIVFGQPGAAKFYFASWTAILVRDVPYGTLQLVFFELLKEFTPALLDPMGFNLTAQRLVWGFFAGAFAGVLTVPVDNISTIVMTELQEKPGGIKEDDDVLELVKDVAVDIWTTRGAEGFFTGAAERALYYAPQACLFFSLYDTFVSLA
eukprot:TRINITY_DN121541_c0_g1_i1.p1 TRINITY_DN121541_c0_g1~~TRINITY_DN121541_c0_g1_i1.p1  ORF type:complete len:690 (+),score=88.67 TRINITY_DN121541_c0_g1_i1:46-2115(+)